LFVLGGYIRYNSETDVHTTKMPAEELQYSYLLDGLTGMQVQQIYRDKSDNMWVSTGGGVTKFEKESARRKVSGSR